MRQQQPQKVQQPSRSTTDVLNNLNKVMLDGAQTSRWLELASCTHVACVVNKSDTLGAN